MNPTRNNKGMLSSFHDESEEFDYDHDIKNTRGRMSSLNSCECEDEVMGLIHRLTQFKTTYRTRPCNPGWCFGLFIPHKSRISARIQVFKLEQERHSKTCNDQKNREGVLAERAALSVAATVLAIRIIISEFWKQMK